MKISGRDPGKSWKTVGRRWIFRQPSLRSRVGDRTGNVHSVWEWFLSFIVFTELLQCSVQDPNELNLDPDPEYWPNLDPNPVPDPGLIYQFLKK